MTEDDDKIILHSCHGDRYTVVAIAYAKWALASHIPNDARLTLLEFLNNCTDRLTLSAIAAVDPMPIDGRELFKEAMKLGRKWPDAVARRDVFDAFVTINPSILTAMRMPHPNGFDPSAMRTI
jgi:hypothetical protein